MVIKYGIISDTHERPEIVPLAIAVLKKEGAEKLIFNGDLGNEERDIVFTLYNVARSGIETFVQPGSHEQVLPFEDAMAYFRDKGNIVNATKNPRIEGKDHDLVFLPGSDWTAGGGEYSITNDETESAIYKTNRGLVHIANMNDLKRQVIDPAKTILVCHVPIKFEGQDGVDVAYFGENSKGNVTPGLYLEAAIRAKAGQNIPDHQLRRIALENGWALKRENRGNKDLAHLCEEIGIKKFISGHFHESAHKVHDSKGNPLVEGELNDELFWNASYLDGGKCGILTVDGNKASYRNIDLGNYVQNEN